MLSGEQGASSCDWTSKYQRLESPFEIWGKKRWSTQFYFTCNSLSNKTDSFFPFHEKSNLRVMSFRFFDYRTTTSEFPLDLLPPEPKEGKLKSLVERCREIPFRENKWISIFLEEGKITAICTGRFESGTAPVEQVGFFHSHESQGRLMIKTMSHLHKLGYRITL